MSIAHACAVSGDTSQAIELAEQAVVIGNSPTAIADGLELLFTLGGNDVLKPAARDFLSDWNRGLFSPSRADEPKAMEAYWTEMRRLETAIQRFLYADLPGPAQFVLGHRSPPPLAGPVKGA